MQTTISQWGNSLGVRIPKSFSESLNIKKGTKVNFTLKNDQIIIEPVEKNTVDLKKLLSQITPENSHPDYWADCKPVGNEIW